MGTVKAQPDVLGEISEKLDTILGFMAIKGIEDDVGKAITRLRNMGLGARVIAYVTGISENAVAIRLTRLKQAEGRKMARGGRKKGQEGSDSPSSGEAG